MKPEETRDSIVKAAHELEKRNDGEDGAAISFDQALRVIQIEQLWRIASINYQLFNVLNDLTESITDDISGSLSLVHNRLNEIDHTLFDTLASAKVGAALDAIASGASQD